VKHDKPGTERLVPHIFPRTWKPKKDLKVEPVITRDWKRGGRVEEREIELDQCTLCARMELSQ
jgi:hypothetical protein